MLRIAINFHLILFLSFIFKFLQLITQFFLFTNINLFLEFSRKGNTWGKLYSREIVKWEKEKSINSIIKLIFLAIDLKSTEDDEASDINSLNNSINYYQFQVLRKDKSSFPIKLLDISKNLTRHVKSLDLDLKLQFRKEVDKTI
ncbi:hypothetical protein BpHYR1_020292 [Brachionus plicatilis]|uniref:Uncharacterized protein n=1 Tax=Brachionus plicatilis TaxID=10195 RepID=A0A3M7PAA6_BRAPC|nr:hypothetical protein BpHYR1_020292 [Brachionus plicatilis]